MPVEDDVNTDEGFLKALAKSADKEVSDKDLAAARDTDTPDVQRGLETTPEQERDEAGKFAGKTQEEIVKKVGAESVAEQPEDEEGEEPEEPEADLASLQKQLQDSQEQIGKQGTELGELRPLREEIAKLQGQIDAIQRTPEEKDIPDLPGVSESEAEALEGMIEESGVNSTLEWVARNRPDMFEAALDVAAQDDPVTAARWGVRYEMALAEERAAATAAEAEPETPAGPSPALQQLELQHKMSQVVGLTAASLGSDWDAAKEHLLPAFEKAPDLVKNAVLSDDPSTREQGVAALAELTKAGLVASATNEAQVREQEKIAEKKKVAGLATGSLRPAPKREPGTTPTLEQRAERIEKFHADLLGVETTSVADGLTTG